MKKDISLIAILMTSCALELIAPELVLFIVSLYLAKQAFVHEYRRRLKVKSGENSRLIPQGGNIDIESITAVRLILSLFSSMSSLLLLRSRYPDREVALTSSLIITPAIFTCLIALSKVLLNQTLSASYRRYTAALKPLAHAKPGEARQLDTDTPFESATAIAPSLPGLARIRSR